MAYLPKHYIKTGLYANPGNFLQLQTGIPYSGPYYEIATGQFFSGESPQDRSTIELTPLYATNDEPILSPDLVTVAVTLDVLTLREGESSNNIQNSSLVNFQVYQPSMVDTYTKLKKCTSEDYAGKVFPYTVETKPTEQDYKVGEFVRFFAKKVNENTYLEVDKTQYESIVNKDPKYFYEQSTAFSLPWSISGEESQAYQTNKNIVQRRVFTFKLFGFDRFIQEDYLKFYKK